MIKLKIKHQGYLYAFLRVFLGIVFIALIIAPLDACSTPARPVIELSPSIQIQPSSIGGGKFLALQVTDARENTPGKANIDSQQDVAQIFTAQIKKALTAKNFVINNKADISANDSSTLLNIQILAIDYRSLSGYVSTNSQTFISAQVSASSPHGKTAKIYNASEYNDNYITAIKQTPSEQMNAAVNKLLNNILNDHLLIQFLAEK